ncbi:MAG: InlB B-repeat-containing protein [Alphaproteobacteria bacterium]|nr:InlB B-repeat-containing protein [Alphaproteobacteria bacterium]
MKLKHLISGILAFFASVFGASESFAVTYLPGEVIENFNYTKDVTFTALYSANGCDAGYAYEGNVAKPCPAGYYCPGEGNMKDGCAQMECPAGSYCISGAVVATKCPTDFPSSVLQSDEEGDCFVANVGAGQYYDVAKNAFATGVSSNEGHLYYYPGGKIYADLRTEDGAIGNGAVACPAIGDYQLKTYGDVVAVSIAECEFVMPAGSYLKSADWVDGAISVGTCEAGTYSEGGLVAYGTTGTACTPCEAGYTSEAGSASCVPESGVLASGYYWNGREVLVCEAGNYCPGGEEYVGAEAAGMYACANGEVCVSGVSAPAICPEGSYCIAGVAYSCAIGYTSNKGATAENQCYLVTTPGNYVALENAKQVTCSAGYYCPGGVTVYYGSTGGAKTCAQLEYAGLEWKDNGHGKIGLSTPSNCVTSIQAGHYFDFDAAEVKVCPENTVLPEHPVLYGDKDSCATCMDGYSTNGQTGAETCTVVKYNISMNANGGTIVGGSSVTPSSCTVETADITLPKPTKTGYTFGGWYQNSDFTGSPITVIAKGACLSDYKLYAKWTANTYTVTFDKNGGVGGTASVIATFGEVLPDAVMPTKTDFIFKGYYSAQTGGVQYYNMNGVPAKWDIDSDITLFAQWMADGECAPGTYYNKESGQVEECPAGKYCAGGKWSTETSETCPVAECPSDYPNSVAGASEEGQCYKEVPKCWCSHDDAECEAKGANNCQYNDLRFRGVTYKANPDMCVAAPGSSDSTYCDIIKVSCKAGTYYTPTGDIEDGSCVSCTTLGDGSFKTSYPSLVKYVADSNTGATACFKSVDLPCTAPICPLEEMGTCTYNSTHSVLGGGYLFYGTDKPLPGSAAAYVCPDSSFTCNTGYDKNESADIDPTDGSASAPEELCTPHVYTFTLDVNGGETANNTIYEKYNTGWYSNAAATDKISKVAVPVRPCYTFAGYYTKRTALEGGVRVIDAMGAILDAPDVSADTTLYAWWNVNTYTVKYNAAGASGVMESVTHTCDEPLNLTPNAFTSATNDRQFMGWATEPNAATPEYTDGQKVVNLTQVNNTTVTLYPVWKACTACAAGNGAKCNLTAPLGVCTYATECKSNYDNLQNNGAYNPVCDAVVYGLTLETNGGKIGSNYTQVSQCTVETGVIVLPTAAQISREDYRFEGWYDNVATAGSAISSIPAGGCTANKTLYAKWVINVEMCQPGMYYNGTSFVTCPKGYYCPGEGKVTIGVAGCRTECPSGYDDGGTGYSDESQCQISVPKGSYLATAKGAEMTVCPAGNYTSDAVLVSYGNTSSCTACEAGSYCSNGTKRSCATETDGVFASSAANSDSIDDCYTLTVAGKYIMDNVVKTCVVPYYCPGDIKVSYGNSGGNLSCADLSDDVAWQSGVTASGASTPDKCYVVVADGKYWNGDAFATCNAGTYKTEHNVYYGQKSSCVTCPAGYTSEAGASECYLITTAGKYVATAGKGEVECKAGDFCPGGTKVMVSGVGGNTACKTLAGGKYSMSAAGTKTADMCYTESCALTENAIAMSGKDYYGADVADTCVATLCEAGFTVAGGACKVCPADNVCDPANDNGAPHKCSELTGGVYTKSAAQTGTVDNCYLTTTAGKYVATAGQGEVDCLAGGYCAGGVDVNRTGTGGREACPLDYAMSGTGASEKNQCYTNCAMYSHATQMTGKDFYGTGVDTCEAVQCETGFVLSNGTCGSCPANSVCDPNYDGGKPHTCSELTNGKYTLSLENTSSIDGCYTITTPGKYVAVAGQGEVACKVGDYCLGGVKVVYTATGGNSACSAFGMGYSSVVGASAETQCYQRCALTENAIAMSGKDYYGADVADTCEATLCEAGFTVVGGACKVCPADNVCDPANDNGAPHKCSELTDGVYTKSAAQNGSVDNCYLITTAGKYVATAGMGMVDCATGGYCAGGVKIMRVGTGGREVCPDGYALSDSGAESAQQCYTSCSLASSAQEMLGRDYYANGTDTCEITLCRPGYTLSDGVCKVCPANNICTPDIERGKPQLCSDLTKGTHKFAPAGSSEISDCYLKCDAYDITYGTAIPVSGTENYPVQCRFDGMSVTKNPCDIVNGTCVERSCNYNYEMVGGKCQACARENALSYKKDGGNCVVESCVSGFHPNGQACEVDTVECSVPNAVAATRVWDASKQAFGECVITECADGYHLGANTCQADEQVCELEHGIGVREWNHKKNTWGDCVATKCDPGYTNDRSQTNELWKQCGRCNNMYSAGGELAASSYVEGCEIATCMYEGELYTLENNECVLICDTYSDETGSRKWNASRKKCERTCEPGYMSW